MWQTHYALSPFGITTPVCKWCYAFPFIHVQVSFTQEERRQCVLAAVLLPLRHIKLNGGKGKPKR